MILINASSISKSYTEKPLLNALNMSIFEGDKIGLIGINGTGKSTLLKILAGEEYPEDGTIIKTNGVRIGFLPQNPIFNKDLSILEHVLQNTSDMERDSKEYEYKSILTKLGITNFDEPVSHLSGGQRKRVALASVLVSPVELLILDEPTNHLDNEMADWLENYLVKYSGAILMVTHDRYFLDRVTNKIAELTGGSIYTYEGNYSYYLEMSLAREEMLLATERKRQALYQKELEWIKRGVRARGTKSKSRIERFEELKGSKLQLDTNKLNVHTKVSRLGKKIIELHHITKCYGEKRLICDFDYTVLRDDRIGILGPNGSGKSTLLKIITGNIPPDHGHVDIGETVKIGYFSQENEEMNLSLRVIDYIQEEAYQVSTSDGTLSASQMLERFLFPSATHSTLLHRLSGGERRRLFLLRLLMRKPNVLILDEPTNDLDIQTLRILEDFLDDFSGAVIVVSHDRYFLDRVVHRTFAFQGNGVISHYPGNFSDYLEVKEQEEKSKPESENKDLSKIKEKENTPNRTEPAKLKFSYNEQREFDTIDSDIQALEEQRTALEAEIAEKSSDYSTLQILLEKQNTINEQLSNKMDRWVYLNDLAEKILAASKPKI